MKIKRIICSKIYIKHKFKQKIDFKAQKNSLKMPKNTDISKTNVKILKKSKH